MTEQQYWEDYLSEDKVNRRFSEMAEALDRLFQKWRELGFLDQPSGSQA